MTDEQWKLILQTCRRFLGPGDWDPYLSQSWCAFTTFSSLIDGVHYFSCGFPAEDDCLSVRTKDGGLWRQSFEYSDLAHVIIPKTFYWERSTDGFQSGYKEQEIDELSRKLVELQIPHRLTNLLLEVKLY